jgi:hypothetical protein
LRELRWRDWRRVAGKGVPALQQRRMNAEAE